MTQKDEKITPTGAVPPIGASLFTDADTFLDERGVPVRIQAGNAPETGKLAGGTGPRGTGPGAIYIPGQVGGERTKQAVQDIATNQGFNKTVYTGKKDNYGRPLGDKANAQGELLSDYLTKTGVYNINGFTQDNTVRDVMNTQVSMKLMPDIAAKEPGVVAAKIIRDANNKEIREQGVNPLRAKRETFNEVEFRGLTDLYSNKGINDAKDNIKYLQDKLATAKTDDARAKIEGEIAVEKLRLQDVATTAQTFGGPMTRTAGRDMFNNSLNPLSDSWDTGVRNIEKGLAGVGDMVGTKTGWDGLKEQASAWKYRKDLEEQGAAKTLSSYKEVNSIGDGVEYVGNLLMSSAPQILMQTAGNLVTGGLGTAASAAVYAGGAWNEQPEKNKNATLAIGTGVFAAVVDQLGIEKVLGGKMGGTIASKADRAKLADAAVKTGKYKTQGEAMKAIDDMAAREVTQFASDAKEMARQQLRAKENVMRIVGSGTRTAGGEGMGEVLQEALGAWGATGNFNALQAADKMTYLDWRDLENRLIESAVGGAVAGGTIGTSSGVKQTLNWAIEKNLKEDYAKDLSSTVQYNQANRDRVKSGDAFGFIDNADAAQKFREADIDGHLPSNPMGPSFELPALQEAGRGSISTRVKEVFNDPWSVFRGAANTAIRSTTKKDGTPRVILPAILSMVSGSGHLQGAHYSRAVKEMSGRWKGEDLDQLASTMSVPKHIANERVRTALDYFEKNSELPEGPEYVQVNRFLENQEAIRQDMVKEARALGIKVPHIDSITSMFRGLDGNKNLGLADITSKNRAIITQEYASAEPAFKNDLQEAMNNLRSSNKDVASTARHWLMEKGVISNPNLKELFDTDPFDSANSAKADLAYQIAQKQYWGKNGDTIGKALVLAWNRGEFDSKEEFYETAHMLDRIRQVTTGEFHTMDNAPKWLNKAYSWGTSLTVFSVLTKTAITAQIETVISTLGHNGDAFNKHAMTYAGELKNNLKSDINLAASGLAAKMGINMVRKVANHKDLKKIDEIDAKMFSDYTTPDERAGLQKEIDALFQKNFHRTMLEHLGYNSNEASLSRYGTAEGSGFNHGKAMNAFAQIIQLKNVTDAQRMGVIAGVPDVVMGQLSTLMDIPNLETAISTRKLTNEQAQAINQLTDNGFDVFGLLGYLKKSQDTSPTAFQDFIMGADPELEALRKSTMSAIGNYVDKHIVDPDAANTPLLYNSPWLRPLTTLKKFTATANAVIIPRLYKEYIKEGNLSMKYDAFATMMMALLMAHATNAAKDLLSWGDEDKHDKKLNSAKKAQRDLYSSGLLGPLNAIPLVSAADLAPVFSDKGTLTRAAGALANGDPLKAGREVLEAASPVFGWATQPYDAVKAVSNGEYQKAAQKIADASPAGGFKALTQSSIEGLAGLFKD